MEKFIEYLETAGKKLQIADHLIYMTFPLVKDKKLLLKILSEINLVILNCINAVLQYEYLYKRIRLTNDAQTNLQTFIQRCSPRYSITQQETNLISRLIELAEKHKKSPFEFVKNNKVVILSENMNSETLTLEKIKEFLTMTKSVFVKIKNNIIR